MSQNRGLKAPGEAPSACGARPPACPEGLWNLSGGPAKTPLRVSGVFAELSRALPSSRQLSAAPG
eukprot:15430884-Alexandrium_andersonii.AAC.1